MEVNPSLWKAITPKKNSYVSLRENIEVDVAIIGSGITGLTAAYQLIQSGKKIAILEQASVGDGTTGFSTGNLYVPVQPLYQNIKFDKSTLYAIMRSRKYAIDYIENLCKKNNIRCSFERRPWFLYANDAKKIKILDKEAALLSYECLVHEDNALDIPFPYKKAIRIDNQARFNPLAYILQLTEILKQLGCQIFENTQVLSHRETDDGSFLATDFGSIKATQVIIATHIPIGINFKQQLLGPYRSYVVAAKLQSGEVPNGNFWDLEFPHHAFSTHRSSDSTRLDIIAVAGNHHKTGQCKDTEHKFKELENYLSKNYDVRSCDYRWSAQHYHSADNIPYIGLASRFAKKTYIATGFFADGLVYGTIAGMILSDHILNIKNEWYEIYDANRVTPFISLPFFIKENSNVFAQYMKDFPGNVQARSQNDVGKNEGKIIEVDGEKVGVYRDEQNKLHCVLAVCTHMKGVVEWNNAEKSWDCPCHGSRFSFDGKVIEGPAILPLSKKELP